MQHGKCSLLIRGDSLNQEEIEFMLNVTASSFIPKGKVISKVIGSNQLDVWVYDVCINEDEDVDDSLKRLLSRILPAKDYLRKISESMDVHLKCYIQSELSQIQFDFSDDTFQQLALLKLKLHFSILSWGKVENEFD